MNTEKVLYRYTCDGWDIVVKKVLTKIYYKIYKMLNKLPVRKRTIVFESFLGKQYSDNPKALYLYMKANYPDYKLYWSFDRRQYDSLQHHVKRPLNRFKIKWLFVMARAEFLVTNSRMPHWIPKSKGTIYVQTWHGTPLKKLGVDIEEVHMPGTTTDKYKRNFTNEAKKWDILVSPNEYSTKIFKRAFDYKNEIIESGYPRNDILYNENNKESIIKLKSNLLLPNNKKVILYAPTWRDNDFYSVGRYKLNLKLDLEKMREKLGDKYIVLVRAHYLVAEQLDLSPYKNFAFDVSLYPDINELYLISDILITDYSSVFFDYANLKRPMIFFTYDIDEYRDELRGFYFDFEKEAPGPIVKTSNEVIQEIKKIEVEGFSMEKYNESFFSTFCSLEDGKASERVVKFILDK